MRQAAITGRTDYVQSWFGNRQTGRWAEQTVGSILTPAQRRNQSLRELEALHARGVVTDAEFEKLRGRLG